MLSDGDPGAGGAQPTAFSVVSRAVILLSKSVVLEGDDDPDFNPGDQVRYTLEVENAGTANATDVVVEDVVDSLITLVDTGGAQISGNTLTWTQAQNAALAVMAPGAQTALSFSGTLAIPLDDGTVIPNQASATSPEIGAPVLSDDPSVGGLADPTVVTIRSAPDFAALSKTVQDLTDDPMVTAPGDQLRYTIVVVNSGDALARNVVVRDPVPTNIAVTVPANAQLVGSELIWDATSEAALAQVGLNNPIALTFTATVDNPLANGTQISNQVSLTSDEIATPVLSDDPATAALDDPTLVSVTSASDLGATTKLVTDLNGAAITEVSPGDDIRYTIEVINRGNAPAENVVVTDVLPDVLAITNPGQGAVAGQSITWDGGRVGALTNIVPGASVILTVEAQVNTGLDDGALILNQAFVTADDVQQPVPSDADPATLAKEETQLVLRASPDLSTSIKEFHEPGGANITVARAGDSVTVTITLINSGDAPARDVQVQDALDTALLTNIVVRDGGALNGNTATWLVPVVQAGSFELLRVDAQVRSPVDPQTLSNQAFFGIGQPPSLPTDNPATAAVGDPTTLDIEAFADLAATTKDVSGDTNRTTEPGAVLTYTIAVANQGDGNAVDLTVIDTLAAELEFVDADGDGVFDPGSRQNHLVGPPGRWRGEYSAYGAGQGGGSHPQQHSDPQPGGGDRPGLGG